MPARLDTPTRTVSALSALALTAALATATVAAPTAQADAPVPFKPGEALTYDVSWTTFLTAGQATLSVKERRPAGATARYHLVAEGRPASALQRLYPLYYKAESLLDTRTLRPAMATLYSDENGRKRHKVSTFHGNGRVDYEIRTSTSATSTITVPATAQDPLGAIYVLRALPLTPGMKPIAIPVTDSGKAYTLRVTVGGRETVRTGIGTVPALKLTLAVTATSDPTAKPSAYTLWISDDARRLPVKFQAGLKVGSVLLTLARVTG